MPKNILLVLWVVVVAFTNLLFYHLMICRNVSTICLLLPFQKHRKLALKIHIYQDQMVSWLNGHKIITLS